MYTSIYEGGLWCLVCLMMGACELGIKGVKLMLLPMISIQHARGTEKKKECVVDSSQDDQQMKARIRNQQGMCM